MQLRRMRRVRRTPFQKTLSKNVSCGGRTAGSSVSAHKESILKIIKYFWPLAINCNFHSPSLATFWSHLVCLDVTVFEWALQNQHPVVMLAQISFPQSLSEVTSKPNYLKFWYFLIFFVINVLHFTLHIFVFLFWGVHVLSFVSILTWQRLWFRLDWGSEQRKVTSPRNRQIVRQEMT